MASPSSKKLKPAVTRKKKVFLVEDHPIFRKALADWIAADPLFEISGGTGDARAAMKALREGAADLFVVDISLNGSDGIELIKNMRAEKFSVQILVLSMHDENIYAKRALRAGAKGYLMKDATGDMFLEALRTVASGEIYVSEAFSKKLIYRALHANGDGDAASDPLACLTDRQLEVFRLLGAGETTASIAEKLILSVKTVETHRMHINEKLGMKNSFELVRFALDFMK